jgi:hypothetical protein
VQGIVAHDIGNVPQVIAELVENILRGLLVSGGGHRNSWSAVERQGFVSQGNQGFQVAE